MCMSMCSVFLLSRYVFAIRFSGLCTAAKHICVHRKLVVVVVSSASFCDFCVTALGRCIDAQKPLSWKSMGGLVQGCDKTFAVFCPFYMQPLYYNFSCIFQLDQNLHPFVLKWVHYPHFLPSFDLATFLQSKCSFLRFLVQQKLALAISDGLCVFPLWHKELLPADCDETRLNLVLAYFRCKLCSYCT